MALLSFMGFDAIPSSSINMTQMPNFLTSSTAGHSKVASQLSGSALSVTSGNRNLVYDDGATHTTFIAAGRIKLTLQAGNTSLIIFNDTSSNAQCTLYYNSADGKIRLNRGNLAGTLLATSTNTFMPGSWVFIEIKVTFHNTAGAYELKVGGASEFSGSSANTRNTTNNYATQVVWAIGTGIDTLDDSYLCDDSGSSPYNDFLGIVRVETLFPTSNDSVQWTPNASTNVSRIQDTASDDDTTYNSDSTTGHIDTFNHGSMALSPTTILAVAVFSRVRKDDVAARTFRNKLISSSTTSNGATQSIDTTYKWIRDQYINDPATSAAWANAAAVNATKIGYELVS